MKAKKDRKIFFFLNHPAHYHLFKNIINRFIKDGFAVKVGIVKKDVLEDLVREEKWDYINLFPEGRRPKNLPIILTALINLFKAEIRLLRAVWKFRPSVIAGTEGTLAHSGFVLRIPTVLFNEDDTKPTPENYIFYPFASKLVLPECCDKGMWQKKRASYPGYHELAYLHPKYFTPDEKVIERFNPRKEKYFILRLADLSASHDVGKKGISDSLATQIIGLLSRHGRVFITSERPLKKDFEKFRICIDPRDIFHALYYAELLIADSQTMSAEAAVLGTPSLRFNDFVGKLGYLNELERKYELTYGIKTADPQKLLDKINELIKDPKTKTHWRNKRKIMIVETIDVAEYFYDVLRVQFTK
ncbi:MAG: DUF354 domain-containing protein [Candidatus Omnitrophica bacterium]|nr:DUF354 domain-containing protein [Candidatus Omnitrophota bacterium]